MAKPLKVFWARGSGGAGAPRNAGDWYSPLVCASLSGRHVVYAPPHQCDLAAVGSLLQRLNRSHRLHRLGLRRRLHIWGTGSLRAHDRLPGNHHVHALRGALSRGQVEAAPRGVPIGDPGLLAEHLLPARPAKRYPLGVLPHLADRDDPQVAAFLDAHPHAIRIDVTAPVAQVLETVAACESLLSSSLHGLAFADAFGVPNRWISVADRLIGGRHKFDDYYSAFGLSLEPTRLDAVDADALADGYARPGIENIKAGLTASFPFRP